MSKINVSFPERYFYRAIQMVYPDTIQQYEVKAEKLKHQTFDVFIPDPKTFIQYQGKFWHNVKTASARTIENDNLKRRYIFETDQYLIEVWEDDRAIQEGSRFIECHMENGYDAVTIKPNPSSKELFEAANVLLAHFRKKLEPWQGIYAEKIARSDIALIKAVQKEDQVVVNLEYKIRNTIISEYNKCVRLHSRKSNGAD